jgi:hypothetical protein
MVERLHADMARQTVAIADAIASRKPAWGANRASLYGNSSRRSLSFTASE